MKNLRNFSLIGLIILLSLVNYVSARNIIPTSGVGEINNEDALIEAFNSTEADFYQSNMNFKSKISDEFMGLDELRKMGDNLVKELNIIKDSSTYISEENENPNYRQITIWGEDHKKRSFTVILLSENDNIGKIQEASIFIDVIQNNNIKDINLLKSNINKIFRDFKTKTEISTCIIGTFKGQLSSSKKVTKITKALKSVNGKKIEGLFQSSLVSVSAYTPNIDQYIYTGNKKMNLNLSIRYNEYEGKTYIWMASPIITIGY